MPLSDLKVRNAKRKEKAYKLADDHGLYLLVTPNGGKLWRWKYRFKGSEKLLSCGTYPVITLAAARDAQIEARRQLAEGLDPSAEKKRKKQLAQPTGIHPF